ncbi:MAG: hypothetical protein KKD28_01660 [Chloroflexi bacterium]|nr:hypothetical protein [Chloroflexota bacterium]MBU1660161.1 hypothetical protein [Chloroflexota bacterium]
MDGIQFVMNDQGQQTAVLIDLSKYGKVWEDFYDTIIAQLRTDEPRESLDFVRENLQQQGKLNA